MGAWLVLGFFVLFFGLAAFNARKAWKLKQGQAERAKRDEAMFTSMFPELQPHFHPENLMKFVSNRRMRVPRAGASTLETVAGFDGVRAEVSNEVGNEVYRLLDKAGTLLATFRYDTHPEGGVLRVGKGKLTVRTIDKMNQRVNYWHPHREFKWSRRKGWAFVTPMADPGMASSDRDYSSSSSSSSSSFRGSSDPVVGGGGTFDGGGASGGWDDAGGSSGGGASSSDDGSTSSTSY